MEPTSPQRLGGVTDATALGSAALGSEAPARAPRNFVWLALHGVVTRIGWIFKTESVIMPAVLDALGGSGALRGMLPLLNRVGQSVPPFLVARRLKIARHKRHALGLASLGQAFTFAAVAWCIAGNAVSGAARIAAFLVLYTAFFGCTGLLNVTLGTLTGKLIEVEHRGRLLTVSTVGGVIPAAAIAWWLLPSWLEPAGQERWGAIFGVTAAFFALAAGCAWALREEPDDYHEAPSPLARQLSDALGVLRRDRRFTTLIGVGILFTGSIMAFPHYQAFARDELGLAGANLMLWVVAQNVAMGAASLFVGPLADRYGNRFVLRILCFATALVPLYVLGLGCLDRAAARLLFPLVFVGIGLVPNGMRILANYTLEVSPASDHPRYLSLLQLSTAAAFLLSPVLGGAIHVIGFDAFFLVVSALGVAGGLLSFALVEPRHAVLGLRRTPESDG